MKLYQYDDIKKANQALVSFKRNKVPIEDIKLVSTKGTVQFFLVVDPVYKPKEKPEVKSVKKKELKPEKVSKPKVKKEETKKKIK